MVTAQDIDMQIDPAENISFVVSSPEYWKEALEPRPLDPIWNTENDDVGAHEIEVTITDGEVAEPVTQTFVLNVRNINDAPISLDVQVPELKAVSSIPSYGPPMSIKAISAQKGQTMMRSCVRPTSTPSASTSFRSLRISWRTPQ